MDSTAHTKGASQPNHGKRLAPQMIEQRAQENPNGEAFSIPRSDDPKDGWKPISWKEYNNAINLVAHKIIEECGEPSPGSFPTIAYIGGNDARYVVMVIAAIKAGFKVLTPMPRSPVYYVYKHSIRQEIGKRAKLTFLKGSLYFPSQLAGRPA